MLASDKTIPKTNAHKKPSTTNPGTNLLTRSIRSAFITKVKSPKVRIFIGKVKIKRMGFKKAFIMPNTKATTKATVKFVTCTPGTTYAMLKITIALIIQLISIPIYQDYIDF